MEKPIAPSPESFGVTAAEVAAAPRLSGLPAVMVYLLMVTAALELNAALSLSAADWAKHPGGYVIEGVLLLFWPKAAPVSQAP
jgi:hypothetical protein